MSVSPSADTRAPWKRFVVATTTMLVLLTSGCTAADDNSTPGDSSTPSGPYPITVENFDGGVTIDKAPNASWSWSRTRPSRSSIFWVTLTT